MVTELVFIVCLVGVSIVLGRLRLLGGLGNRRDRVRGKFLFLWSFRFVGRRLNELIVFVCFVVWDVVMFVFRKGWVLFYYFVVLW